MPFRLSSPYFFTAAFIGSCFFICACENDPQVVDSFFVKRTAVEEGYGIDSYLSQGTRVKARLRAPYMKRYMADSPYVEFPNTLHVDFLNDSTQQVESILDAHYARHMEYQRKVLLKDSVVVINLVKGDTLRTAELWWDQNQEQFFTDKPVRIYQKTGYTYGRSGMQAKQDFSEWWILGSSGQRLVADTGFVN